LKNLIAALRIFAQYTDSAYPTGCTHDELHVYVDPREVSDADIVVLEKRGFFVTSAFDDHFTSHLYGSA